MRRLVICLLSLLPIAVFVDATRGQEILAPLPQAFAKSSAPPKLRQLSVPASQARQLATTLSLRYQDVPGVTISPDARNQKLVVMAPDTAQQQIAKDVRVLLNRGMVRTTSAQVSGPLQVQLANISWQQFEGTLHAVAGDTLPVTTSRNGMKAIFQLTAAPMAGTTVEVDRAASKVTVIAPQPTLPGWQKLIAALDQMPSQRGDVTELMRIENADPAPIQRMLRLLRELEQSPDAVAVPINNNSPFRNAVFQAPNQNTPGAAQRADETGEAAGDGEGGTGVIGDTQIQFVPELGQIIIRGAKRDVARVMEVIKEIELKSKLTQPEIEVVPLKHTDANAVAALLTQLYDDVLSARQGDVSITSLDHPNALLLIGRKEAVESLRELISKIDLPIEESNRLRVFRLQHASALDAEQAIRDFFTDRPGSSDDLRPGLGTRVRVLADYRTNSLIVSAAPRDMVEVTRLVNELDVIEIPAQQQLKIFPLINASAEDLATTLQGAISGDPEDGSENVTLPATALSIVAIDGQQAIDSGVLAGVTVTADVGANAIVVRAPAGSMALIAELIRQLDKAPNIDSFVKVFTIKNGDATQLTTALSTLFGDEAATQGTQVGGANVAGLPAATASAESSLIPLRFSTDIRTNSIIVSGSSEDLEVVESILLRLDSEGFAERINEVIWLRHNDALVVAQAITDYVTARRQSQTSIQQYQQGLGPYDLIDRDLIAIPEVQSNSILLSVSPRLYEEVRRLIDRLDRRRPLILIKVMLAEVELDDTFEIGGEVGLQDSLQFNRGLAVADPTTGIPGEIPGIGGAGDPGFNFNDAGVPNVNRFGQENLAATGVTTFGVGTISENLNYGGFVLNAASESVSLLLRTLQEAKRLQVLSRPQVMTMDNTESLVRVGRKIARVTDVINNGLNTQVVTQDIDVGLILNVRPRVGRDGLITMDIDATRSERDNDDGTFVPAGDGQVVFINDILDTTAQSTLTAYSGQTVIFGGLIQKVRGNLSRRVPYLGDLPLLGYFFKYDQETELRRELLIIMTPMLITGDQDLEYVKHAESSRMSWCLADVVEAHGDVGLSGGYGLWGPAVGPTIYPDLHPTVQREVVISDEPVPGVPNYSGDGQYFGDQGPIISEPAGNPIMPPSDLPPPAEQPLPPSPPAGALPNPSPHLLPGAAVPDGSGAAVPGEINVPMPLPPQSPSDVEIPTETDGQLLSRVSQADQAFNTNPVGTAAEQAIPVAWFQQSSSDGRLPTGAARPLPKRLGDTSDRPTPAADVKAHPETQPAWSQRIPSISPRSWIK